MSQSVEHDHPKTFEFLRTDIRNIEDFFKRRSGGELRTLGPRRTWEFIVSESVGLSADDELGDEGEKRLASIVTTRLLEDHDETDDAVFMSSFIPRTLGEVYDPERDVDLVNAGRGDELIYSTLTGMDQTKDDVSARVDDGQVPGATAVSEEDVSEESDAGEAHSQPRGHRNEDKDAKKVRPGLQTRLHTAEQGCRSENRRSRRPNVNNVKEKCLKPRRSV